MEGHRGHSLVGSIVVIIHTVFSKYNSIYNCLLISYYFYSINIHISYCDETVICDKEVIVKFKVKNCSYILDWL